MKRVATIACLMGFALAAPVTATAQGMDLTMKGQYNMVKDWVTKSAAMMPEANYSFKATPDVRTFGQVLGHIANATGLLCIVPAGGKSPLTGDAEKLTTKAELTKALADVFAACDKAWAAMTPASGAATVDVFGNKTTISAALAFNTAHTFEHYGNLVTYLRLKGLVPPSTASGR
jgi:uncharacterized damage-inducible protein DinB